MTKAEKEKFKSKFKKDLKEFTESLKEYVSTETGEWTVKGFIDVYKNIYTISSDTKIVSKILEIHIFPKLLKFADSIGYPLFLLKNKIGIPTLVSSKRMTTRLSLPLI